MITNEIPVTIAIIGPVSVGKSTLLNGILGGTYSDMQRKKTTMLPQWYNVRNNKQCLKASQIYQTNNESNKKILENRNKNLYDDESFVPLQHDIEPIYDFLNLPENTQCRVLDMPGLNCGGGNSMYYKYIKKISNNIDIYVLVFDINSCLNTTDEIEILKLVNEEITKNQHGHIIVLMNKFENVEYNKNSFDIKEYELKEMFESCKEIINSYLCNKFIKNIPVLPICASELYLYRSVNKCIDEVSEKNIDYLIITEAGKIKLNELKTLDEKKEYVKMLLNKKHPSLYNVWMNASGYHLFTKHINSILVYYPNIVLHYIKRVIKIVGDPCESVLFNIQKFINVHNILNSLILTQHCENKTEKIINIIPQSIIEKLKSAMDLYNNTILKIIDNHKTKNEKTTDNVNFWIKWIDQKYNLMHGNWLYVNNPMQKTRNIIVLYRYHILNQLLLNEYNNEIFIELYDNSQLNLEIYYSCIDRTLSNNNISFEQLLMEVYKNTSTIKNNLYSENDIILPIINCFLKNYIENKSIDIYNTCRLILDVTNENLDVLIRFIWHHLNFEKNLIHVAGHWIDSMLTDIKNKSKKLQYIYYNLNIKIKQNLFSMQMIYIPQINFNEFTHLMDTMTFIHNNLCHLLDFKRLPPNDNENNTVEGEGEGEGESVIQSQSEQNLTQKKIIVNVNKDILKHIDNCKKAENIDNKNKDIENDKNVVNKIKEKNIELQIMVEQDNEKIVPNDKINDVDKINENENNVIINIKLENKNLHNTVEKDNENVVANNKINYHEEIKDNENFKENNSIVKKNNKQINIVNERDELIENDNMFNKNNIKIIFKKDSDKDNDSVINNEIVVDINDKNVTLQLLSFNTDTSEDDDDDLHIESIISHNKLSPVQSIEHIE